VAIPAFALPRSEFPPSVGEFFTPAFFDNVPALTKFTFYAWVAVAIIIVFFLVAYRKPKIVPSFGQWMAESIYNFNRENIAKGLIGHEGVRFAPYFTTLFCFILLTNLFGIIPFIQISTNSHIAFPIILAVISYVMFNYI